MITEAEWTTWKPGDLKPYIDHVLATFGPERVLFGSDWPVCLLAGSYDRVVAALETGLAHLSVAEREMIFGANAVRLYQLKDIA
ncbi:MAG: amidohydrolase family protein, partial [Verrucomicrobiota bacterium]